MEWKTCSLGGAAEEEIDVKVKDIMSTDVVSVGRDTTIEEVARILVHNGMTSAPVVDDHNQIIGIVSEKDLIYKDIDPSVPSATEYLGGIIFLNGLEHYHEALKKLTATRVEQMMTREVITVKPDDTIKELGRMLVDAGINSIPVTEKGKLVGIVSSTDIVKTLLQ